MLAYLNTQDISSQEKEHQMNEFYRNESAMLRARRSKIGQDDFTIIQQIGKGGFGKVFLAENKRNKRIVALKRMNKKFIIENNEVNHIINERNVLVTADSPWLIKLFESFQNDNYVFLSMEYAPGGDLRTLLHGAGALKEENARFYMIEMTLCVHALHELGFIHRDLKPENYLIDARGHLKLTDFGLAKGIISSQYQDRMQKRIDQLKNKAIVKYSSVERKHIYKTIRSDDRATAYSVVGSPDYIAPEMLSNLGYTLLTDYWSLGCILFEILAAYVPFAGSNSDEVWVNVFRWREVLERPVYEGADAEFNLTDEAWDLITKLITDADKRLSSPSQLSHHPWFYQVDWSVIRDVTPPFVPEIRNMLDTQYFEGSFDKGEDDSMILEASIDHAQPRHARPRAVFQGWTYKQHQVKHNGPAAADASRQSAANIKNLFN